MAVSQGTKRALHARAGGKCECTMSVCDHRGRCTRHLSPGNWDAHHRSSSGSGALGNLIAMCGTCHKNTRNAKG